MLVSLFHKLTLTLRNFHLVVHHLLIVIVSPLPPPLKLFTSRASLSLLIKSWNSMLSLSFVRIANSNKITLY